MTADYNGWTDSPEEERETLNRWEEHPLDAHRQADAFNAWVAEVCATHPELHVVCPTCSLCCCLYWTEQENDPDARCTSGHPLSNRTEP